MDEVELLKKQVKELQDWKKSLEASHSIPLRVDQAFRERFAALTAGLTVSSKPVAPEAILVDEAGTDTYFVMSDFDGFLKITVDGIVRHVGYYL